MGMDLFTRCISWDGFGLAREIDLHNFPNGGFDKGARDILLVRENSTYFWELSLQCNVLFIIERYGDSSTIHLLPGRQLSSRNEQWCPGSNEIKAERNQIQSILP
jgi:hypothetical protein